MLSSMNFLSPDSRCYSFDNRANGYARGEGVGVVILKKLSDAIRNNDTIRAVIRATGSNSDGHTPGITQPSKDAQERLIGDTYAKAGLNFGETRFFEAHGKIYLCLNLCLTCRLTLFQAQELLLGTRLRLQPSQVCFRHTGVLRIHCICMSTVIQNFSL